MNPVQVAAGEAVHAFASWRDLKGRLDDHNRRWEVCRLCRQRKMA